MAHATFGIINKGGADPFLNRGAINVWYGLIAFPFALFVFPLPTAELWWVIAAAFVIHLIFELLQASMFYRGAFTLVYPLSRGMGPLGAVALAYLVFEERFSLGQYFGAFLLSGAIMAFALVNLKRLDPASTPRGGLRGAIIAAILTGLMIAVYTIVDAYGVRIAEDPFTFIIWFFALGIFGSPVVAVFRWFWLEEAARPQLRALAARGLIGALVAFVSFGSLMLATRVGSVGQAAALRETSIIFGTALGVFVLREKIDATRLILIGLIAMGAVLIEIG